MITLAKFLAYMYSGSSAMSSEAIHSFVDSANQLLLLVGLRSASMAPDKLHQYGHGTHTVVMIQVYMVPIANASLWSVLTCENLQNAQVLERRICIPE